MGHTKLLVRSLARKSRYPSFFGQVPVLAWTVSIELLGDTQLHQTFSADFLQFPTEKCNQLGLAGFQVEIAGGVGLWAA